MVLLPATGHGAVVQTQVDADSTRKFSAAKKPHRAKEIMSLRICILRLNCVLMTKNKPFLKLFSSTFEPVTGDAAVQLGWRYSALDYRNPLLCSVALVGDG